MVNYVIFCGEKFSEKKIIFILILFLLLCFNTETFSQKSITTIKNTLESQGFQLDLVYTADINQCLLSRSSRNLHYLDVIDVMFGFDFKPIFSWKGARFCVDVMGIHGTDPSKYIGDIQGVSNIAAYHTWKFSELWFQQNLWNDSFSILAGIYDINSEFDVLETAGIFLNSSFGMGPEFSFSGINGAPTFPNSDPGLRIKIKACDRIVMQTAVFDAIPGNPLHPCHTCYQCKTKDGLLFVSEIMLIKGEKGVEYRIPYTKRMRKRRHRIGFNSISNFLHSRSKNRRRKFMTDVLKSTYSKYALGVWYNSNCIQEDLVDHQESSYHSVGWGVYGLAEKMLITDHKNPQNNVSGFIRLGIADKKSNRIDGFMGCGLVWSGFSFHHRCDQLGIAAAAAHKSDRYILSVDKDQKYSDWEVVFEISYRMRINYFLYVQPDFQYIFNPGFNSKRSNVGVGNIRIEFAL